MTDPRKLLTEETPESPEDFKQRGLTEVKGSIRHDARVLTEDLPEDEDIGGAKTLLG